MSDEPGAYIYMLRCADDSFYVGSARRALDRRVSEHNEGVYRGYTSTRHQSHWSGRSIFWTSRTPSPSSVRSKGGPEPRKKRWSGATTTRFNFLRVAEP